MSLPNPINVTYVSPLISDTFPFQYIVKDTDNIINIDTTHGEVHVILRNIRSSGMLQYQPLLSINDGSNNAFLNNIIIYPSEGDTINDATSYILNTNGANSIIQLSGVNQWVVASSQNPIPFEGNNYVYVYGNGTPLENGQELINGYERAKGMVGYNSVEQQIIDVGTIDVIIDDYQIYWETDSMPITETLNNYLNYVGNYFNSLIMTPPLEPSSYTVEVIINSEENTYQIRCNYNLEIDSRFGVYEDVQLGQTYNYNLINLEELEIVISIPEDGYFQSAIYNKSILSPYLTDSWNSMSLKINGIFYTNVTFEEVDVDTFYFAYNTLEVIPEVGTYNNVICSISEAIPSDYYINPVSLIIGAGIYTLPETWIVDVPMNIVSLTGNADVNLSVVGEEQNNEYNALLLNFDDYTYFILNSFTDYIWKIKGLSTEYNRIYIETDKYFIIENCVSYGLNSFCSNTKLNIDFINCIGENYSFNAAYCYGTYTNCIASNNSFGHGAELIEAIYDNCVSNGSSFGSGFRSFGAEAIFCNGTYKNCTGGRGSFGSYAQELNGSYENCISTSRESFGFEVTGGIYALFKNCQSGTRSFGVNRNAYQQLSASFINCKSGSTSFGYDDDYLMDMNNSYFENCEGSSSCFGINLNNSSQNKFINCRSSGGSFDASDSNYYNCISNGSGFNFLLNCNFFDCKASGNSFNGIINSYFYNCIADVNSFGFGVGQNLVSCYLYNCTSNSYSFWGWSSFFYNCQGFDNCFNTAVGQSNEFNNCVASLNSFVAVDSLTNPTEGKLFFCRLTEGTFPSSTGVGLIRQSIDGNNDLINQDAPIL